METNVTQGDAFVRVSRETKQALAQVRARMVLKGRSVKSEDATIAAMIEDLYADDPSAAESTPPVEAEAVPA